VPGIDAHAKFDALLCRYRGIAGDHLPLHLDRTAHRIDDAGELDEEAVAGGFDDATAMLGDFGIAKFTANRSQRCERALFVLAHQPRIAGDIDRKNGCQSSLDADKERHTLLPDEEALGKIMASTATYEVVPAQRTPMHISHGVVDEACRLADARSPLERPSRW